MTRSRVLTAGLVAAGILALSAPAHAYIGPGAGFALISSFFTVVAAVATAVLALAAFPVRALVRAARRRRATGKARYRKVIVLGLDGLEPTIVEPMLDSGELPHLASLRERGTYARLGTSTPALSPVAWSTFATGSDASRHAIWDFLARDRGTYLPRLSSSEVAGRQRFWSLGPFRIPRGGTWIRKLQRSKTFWKVLSEHGIFASVLRVPITFPVEPIDGVMVAGMCAPDLRGTQGSFTYFTTSREEAGRIGGLVIVVEEQEGMIAARLPGPVSPFDGKALNVALRVNLDRAAGTAELRVGGETHVMRPGETTPWVSLGFRAAPGITIRGIARFRLTSFDPFGLYVTPIHIDPARPAMPISHPAIFSIHMAKLIGPHATLGLAEDTWAMNEGVLDEDGWLEQAYAIHEERRAMWFHSLDRLRSGMVACVFDVPDRLQHMFFRHRVPDHPANRDRPASRNADAIAQMYRRMDALVGETLAFVDAETALFVLSDHGFKPFRRGVDLNAWLVRNGLMTLRDGAGPGEWLRSVDWSRTQAYAIGLGNIYVNVRGREREGIVEPGEVAAVKRDIQEALTGLHDGATLAVRRVIDVRATFDGPYRDDGPELIPGFAEGYRASWDCARGAVGSEVFTDNTKPWSGDHAMDPEIVPGVLFSNVRMSTSDPRLMDLGPTVLDLFGVERPGYMTGRSLA